MWFSKWRAPELWLWGRFFLLNFNFLVHRMAYIYIFCLLICIRYCDIVFIRGWLIALRLLLLEIKVSRKIDFGSRIHKHTISLRFLERETKKCKNYECLHRKYLFFIISLKQYSSRGTIPLMESYTFEFCFINPLPSGRRTDWPYTHLNDKCSKKA